MKLETGRSQLLRLEAVTALHTGSAAGEASLDRPVQKDAQTGLPFLPDSALKGVLAGRYGDVPDDMPPNKAREDRFGSPDRSGRNGDSPTTGRPSPIVLGNGELLAFPIPSQPGPTWAFPALTLAWALRFEPAPADTGLLSFLSEIENSIGSLFVWPKAPLLDVPVGLRPLSGVTLERHKEPLVALLRRLAGPSLPEDAPLAVLSSHDAGRLWPAASERRALTALDASTRTVADGALRRVELVPSGAVFLSLVTCETEAPAAARELDDDLFQIGAWESLGLGWVRPSLVPSAPPPPAPAEQNAAPPGFFDATRVMVEAHQAVCRLMAETASPLRRAVRSAARRFGGRAQFSGLEAAFAFELAKAKPAHSRPSKDARAHRWLLAALLSPAPEPPAEDGPDSFLLSQVEAGLFTPGHLAGLRELILTRWLWVARYLDTDPGAEPGEEVEL